MQRDEQIRVRMAEYSIAKDPEVIVTIGLGSCVGITLYDKFKKVGGMIHIMLPENRKGMKPAKYADTGIPLIIKELEKVGAKKRNLEAKIAGGAKMFNISESSSTMRVGERNIIAVKSILADEGIRIIGEDTGEDYGRTMVFHTENGSVLIKSYKKDDHYL